jgi:hypothetical protein
MSEENETESEGLWLAPNDAAVVFHGDGRIGGLLPEIDDEAGIIETDPCMLVAATLALLQDTTPLSPGGMCLTQLIAKKAAEIMVDATADREPERASNIIMPGDEGWMQ